jgi:iron complex outermembrane recepter protein
MRKTNKPNRPAFAPSAIALATIAACGPAQAQSTSEPAGGGLRVEVTGFRASLDSALRAKRDDRGIIDVVKSEDIAKFPDTNLAESLQRVPGVVIARDAGEGRQITVRGLGGDFVRVRINGIEALATTGGTDSSGGNNRSRMFDFNVFPAELFNAITVRKSASADVDEGGLGATVDLQTPRPFDFKGSTFTLAAKARYNDLSKTTDPRLAFLASTTNADRTVGVLLAGAFSKRRLYEEGFGTVRWDNGPSNGGWCSPQGSTPLNPTTTATTCGPAAQNVPRQTASPGATSAYNLASSADNFHPRLPRYGRLTHDQDRLGLNASLQLRPREDTQVTLDVMFSKITATRQEDFLQAISFSRALSSGGKPQTSVISTDYAANGALLFGQYNGVDIRSEQRYDELSTEFTQPTLTIDHEFTERLKGMARVGQAKSRFRNPQQTTTTLDAPNVNGYAIDFRGNDRLPAISYPIDVTQPGGALGIVGVPTGSTSITNGLPSEIRVRPQGTDNRIDVQQYTLDWEAIPDTLNIKGGVDHKRYVFSSFEFRRNTEVMFAPPTGVSNASLSTLLDGFGSQLGMPAGTPTAWVIPNLPAIASTYDIYCNCLKSGPANGPGDFRLTSITNGNARGNNRAVVENDKGLFLMADFSTRIGGQKIMGNAGVRYVRTTQSATGYLATGGGTPVSVDNDYSDTLPAINLSTEVAKDLLLRVAGSKTMSRPLLANLNPGGTINTTGNLTINTGNPVLKPIRSTNADVNLEWYHQPNALVGVGAFHKKINVYAQTLVQSMPFRDTGLPMSLLPSNFTGDEIFTVTTPVNTPGGNLYGVELNVQQPFTFLPGIGRNFGALLNYTYVKSRIAYAVTPTSTSRIEDDLVNLSPRSWNATLYYDDGRLSARISASNRSSYLTRVPGQNNNDVEGTNGSTNVDLSISYKLNDTLELTFEGINLTNEANDQFISRARNSAVWYSKTGREYMAGVRVKF